jgi:hypothetical protein
LDSAPVGLLREGVVLHRALPGVSDYALSELFMIVYNLPIFWKIINDHNRILKKE